MSFRKRLLVCDLDNTLYDWVGYFVPSFLAMFEEAVKLLECDREQLLDDFREVHRRHSDAEHPFALLETQTVRAKYPHLTRNEVAHLLDSAFYAFNSARKRSLQLYPGVLDTLVALEKSGIILVAHTESKMFAVVDRLSRLGIERYFSRIYCRERPDTLHPHTGANWDKLEAFPMGKVTELKQHQRKPSPEVLLEICDRERVATNDVAYVGDSLTRDILMAQRAGVFGVWARYGTRHDPDLYGMLVRVSHWTSEEVSREQQLASLASPSMAGYVAERSFSELLPLLGLTEPS